MNYIINTPSQPPLTFIQTNYPTEWSRFSEFRERFHKRYDTTEDIQNRFYIFKQTWQTITEHNTNPNKPNFTMTINQFSDLSPSEFNKKHVGIFTSSVRQKALSRYGCSAWSGEQTLTSEPTPTSIDWRDYGAVTPVKDQGSCGSCWSFSATGAMEGSWAISSGQLESLSEEQLVNCASGVMYGSHGCSGGQMDGAFKYAIETGMYSDYSYPYTATDSNECYSPTNTMRRVFSSCWDITSGDQVALKEAVSRQPVSVAIEADSRYFQSYADGVLDSVNCGTNLDHGVLIVGYGFQTETAQPYWLVKNSWSDEWGAEGYVKIARSESRTDEGICGIAIQPSFIKA